MFPITWLINIRPPWVSSILVICWVDLASYYSLECLGILVWYDMKDWHIPLDSVLNPIHFPLTIYIALPLPLWLTRASEDFLGLLHSFDVGLVGFTYFLTFTTSFYKLLILTSLFRVELKLNLTILNFLYLFSLYFISYSFRRPIPFILVARYMLRGFSQDWYVVWSFGSIPSF